MKNRVAMAFLSLALIASSAQANVRHHRHRLHPIVAGLGAGLIHMLQSMKPHQEGQMR